ncbi:hypothetical protein ONE63_003130 [Megalurothrips usitatus]|uniref:Major facilitator superfamily (MFS) profile domain-containing protein n=1 Tax=Megalurothrips usitatus TaxID=439358 RepID=A0AAV7X9V0_9NEOP|nr:hypothetical protein ONE63_003130 [Megalurothrips usitatus]
MVEAEDAAGCHGQHHDLDHGRGQDPAHGGDDMPSARDRGRGEDEEAETETLLAADDKKTPILVQVVSAEGAAADEKCEKPIDAVVEAKKHHASRRQLMACCAVASVNLLGGVCLAHSSSLIPALEGPDSEVPVEKHHAAWIASALVLAVPVGSLVSLCVNDYVGRLSLCKLISVPFFVGMALIASAGSLSQVVAGRLVLGLAAGIWHGPSVLYISEVADKNIRGGLGAFGPAVASLGILVCYAMGAALHWRTHAWLNCLLPLVTLALLYALAMETPVWLRAHGSPEAAAAASLYFYNDPDKVLSVASGGKKKKKRERTGAAAWRMLFLDPRGYKPLIIIHAVFIVQQIVGIYISIYYAVSFFKETGSTIDPYMATILIGVVRLVGCSGVSLVLSRLGRRPLMIASSLGQAAAMAVSGYASRRILAGDSVSSMWVVAGVLVYILFACLGWQVLPWSMMAELFPHEVRSAAQPLNTGVVHFYMFVFLQLYPTVLDLVGGAANLMFLFSGTSALSAVFVFVFLPETRGRTLAEIEEYFRHNTTFLTERRRQRREREARREAQRARGAV